MSFARDEKESDLRREKYLSYPNIANLLCEVATSDHRKVSNDSLQVFLTQMCQMIAEAVSPEIKNTLISAMAKTALNDKQFYTALEGVEEYQYVLAEYEVENLMHIKNEVRAVDSALLAIKQKGKVDEIIAASAICCVIQDVFEKVKELKLLAEANKEAHKLPSVATVSIFANAPPPELDDKANGAKPSLPAMLSK